MTRATIKYIDDKKRRIILPKEITEIEDLHSGDFIEIDVKKIKNETQVERYREAQVEKIIELSEEFEKLPKEEQNSQSREYMLMIKNRIIMLEFGKI